MLSIISLLPVISKVSFFWITIKSKEYKLESNSYYKPKAKGKRLDRGKSFAAAMDTSVEEIQQASQNKNEIEIEIANKKLKCHLVRIPSKDILTKTTDFFGNLRNKELFENNFRFEQLREAISSNGQNTPAFGRMNGNGKIEIIYGLSRSVACRLEKKDYYILVADDEVSDDDCIATSNFENNHRRLSFWEKSQSILNKINEIQKLQIKNNNSELSERQLAEELDISRSQLQYYKKVSSIPVSVLKYFQADLGRPSLIKLARLMDKYDFNFTGLNLSHIPKLETSATDDEANKHIALVLMTIEAFLISRKWDDLFEIVVPNIKLFEPELALKLGKLVNKFGEERILNASNAIYSQCKNLRKTENCNTEFLDKLKQALNIDTTSSDRKYSSNVDSNGFTVLTIKDKTLLAKLESFLKENQ